MAFQSHCQLKSLLRFCLQTPEFVLNEAPVLCAMCKEITRGAGLLIDLRIVPITSVLSFDSNDLSTWPGRRSCWVG